MHWFHRGNGWSRFGKQMKLWAFKNDCKIIILFGAQSLVILEECDSNVYVTVNDFTDILPK